MADAIRKGMLVTISLVMADMTGRTLEETPPEGMVYLHGEGDIFPRLEKRSKGILPARASPFISNLKKLLANTMPMRFGAYPWRTLRIPNVWKWESSWTKCPAKRPTAAPGA